jgi:hypothetical protein
MGPERDKHVELTAVLSYQIDETPRDIRVAASAVQEEGEGLYLSNSFKVPPKPGDHIAPHLRFHSPGTVTRQVTDKSGLEGGFQLGNDGISSFH